MESDDVMADQLLPYTPGPNIPQVSLNAVASGLVQEIEDTLGVNFTNKALLLQAFIHKSYVNPDLPLGNNERLECLGDSVLRLIIRDHLFVYFDLDEGPMTHIGSQVESTANLALIADSLQLSRWLLRSPEEKEKGPPTAKQKCDTLEAVVGAIYIDGGLESARGFVRAHVIPTARMNAVTNPRVFNPKATLRNRVFNAEGVEPSYSVIQKNPGYYQMFVIGVFVKGRELGRGEGTSKRLAEIAAAIEALKYYKPPF